MAFLFSLFELICTLAPLFCVTVVAQWSGILFKSYDASERGRVREIAARSLGLFLGMPLLGLYLIQLSLFLKQGVSFESAQSASAFGFLPSFVLIGFGLLLWCYVRSCGRFVDGEQQAVNAFIRRSYRLSAIGSIILTVAIIVFLLLFPMR